MNALDAFAPPEDDLILQIDEEEDEEERARLLHLFSIRNERIRKTLERQRRRRMADQQAKDVSSDSEVDEVTKGLQKAKVDVTPAESTPPQELVKLDP